MPGASDRLGTMIVLITSALRWIGASESSRKSTESRTLDEEELEISVPDHFQIKSGLEIVY